MRAGRADGDGRWGRPDDRTAKIQSLRPTSLLRLHADRAEVSLKRIQKLMGHEKIETTLNVYGHVIERVEGASEKRSGMLALLLSA